MILSEFLKTNYEVHEFNNAGSILQNKHADEWSDIEDVTTAFTIDSEWISEGGGSNSQICSHLSSEMAVLDWETEKSFSIETSAGTFPTHSIDCFKNKIAFEIEWNSKNTSYYRDLSVFRLLHEKRIIKAAVIVTRCDSLQKVFVNHGKGQSAGSSTTHISNLLPLVHFGLAGKCPILVMGIRETLVVYKEKQLSLFDKLME